jgi:glycosyltransferase involved in cell wall biosynthesis
MPAMCLGVPHYPELPARSHYLARVTRLPGVAACGRFLREAQPTGTQRSAKQLLVAAARYSSADLAVYAPENALPDSFGLELRPTYFAGGAVDHLWEQCIFPLVAPERVLFTLTGTGPVIHAGKRHVMVVHDLNYAILPHVFGRSFRTWYRFACGRAAKAADALVCFSDYVSLSLQRRLGVRRERIHVIPQGPGLSGLDQPMEAPITEAAMHSYFLCVGGLQPHKNLIGILNAWKIFRRHRSGFSLKIVGRPQRNFAKSGVDLLAHLPDVEFTGYISDSELIELYRHATAFLYPSFEEGFGLPVVEAFYCGCPVITSNCSCLPEIAGNAALLVDPSDIKDIVSAMNLLATNEARSQNLRACGFRRAKLFTWEGAGRQMASILDTERMLSKRTKNTHGRS